MNTKAHCLNTVNYKGITFFFHPLHNSLLQAMVGMPQPTVGKYCDVRIKLQGISALALEKPGRYGKAGTGKLYTETCELYNNHACWYLVLYLYSDN